MSSATLEVPASPPVTDTHRVAAIDIVRGIVMVLMAIDHVRVYAGVPAGGPDPAVLFTRWITHFVAPAFVFLAGTSAFLHGQRLASRGDLSRFLLTRGLWLIVLEMTVIRVSWTFNFAYDQYLLAGVIWVIGIAMILMVALVHLPQLAIAAVGLTVIFGHNIMDYVTPDGLWDITAWKFLYFGGAVSLGDNGPNLMILYTIIPWIGVMAAGYGFGALMMMPAERRRMLCTKIGATAILLFLILRFMDGYGNQAGWRDGDQGAAFIRFLNTAKYPASLQFLLMTLGPTILLVGLLDRARGPVAYVLATFGRVPLFYYLLHIPLIHFAAVIVSLLRTGAIDPWLFGNHPMATPPVPDGYRWSLPLLYLVTAAVVTVLYFPGRRFARLKEQRRDLKWLSYL